MPTYADILRELADLLDKDFETNKKKVSKELSNLSKSLKE